MWCALFRTISQRVRTAIDFYLELGDTCDVGTMYMMSARQYLMPKGLSLAD